MADCHPCRAALSAGAESGSSKRPDVAKYAMGLRPLPGTRLALGALVVTRLGRANAIALCRVALSVFATRGHGIAVK